MSISRTRFPRVCIAALTLMTSACSHHPSTMEATPAALAAVHADIRLVGSETTWVTHGTGYELIGRSRADLAVVQPALDHASAFLAQAYPRDSITRIVAKIRRAPAPGKPFVTAAPLPPDTKGPVVELVIVDPQALEEARKKKDGPPSGPGMEMMGGNIVAPAVRAWLSARASHLTDTHARLDQSSGEVGDPRVPAWAPEVISSAGDDAMVDNATKNLAAHVESTIPLNKFFTMERPTPTEMASGRRGGSGEGPQGGGTGGMGGMGGMGGGRGGMGGGRGGMGGGRGGMGGGRGGSRGGGSSGEHAIALQGFALYDAQAAALTKYFTRTGVDIVGDLIDAQIRSAPLEDVLTKHNMGTLTQMDAEWQSWLVERAATLSRP